MAGEKSFPELRYELHKDNLDYKIDERLKNERNFNVSVTDIETKRFFFETEVEKYIKKNEQCKKFQQAMITIEVTGSIAGLSAGAIITATGVGSVVAIPITSAALAAGGAVMITAGYFLDKKRRRYARTITLAKLYKAEFEKLYKDAIADKVVNENEYKSLVSKFDHYKTEKKSLSNSTSFDANISTEFKQELIEALQTVLLSKNLSNAETSKLRSI
ncbi:MAG: hypothetical protein AAGG81_08645 [Chlamydiota bacterium]